MDDTVVDLILFDVPEDLPVPSLSQSGEFLHRIATPRDLYLA